MAQRKQIRKIFHNISYAKHYTERGFSHDPHGAGSAGSRPQPPAFRDRRFSVRVQPAVVAAARTL
jgi:hypothetical protein